MSKQELILLRLLDKNSLQVEDTKKLGSLNGIGVQFHGTLKSQKERGKTIGFTFLSKLKKPVDSHYNSGDYTRILIMGHYPAENTNKPILKEIEQKALQAFFNSIKIF